METAHEKDEWWLTDISAGRYIHIIHEVGKSVLQVTRQAEQPFVSIKRVPSGLTEGEPMQLLGSINYHDAPIDDKDITPGRLVVGAYPVLGEALLYLPKHKTHTSLRPQIMTLRNIIQRVEIK